MTYVVDLTLSLVRALERASFFRDERLAGHAANADFWAAEVRHVLDVLATSEARYAAWREAMKVTDGRSPVSQADLQALQSRLIADATRFFRLISRHLDRGQIQSIEQLLGIDIAHVSHNDLD